jgi:hypothetical protein
MSVDDRIEAALASDECAGVATLLAALVYSLRAEGMSKQEIGAAFQGARERMRVEGRREQAAAVGAIVAVLAGECAAGARLLPNEPDVKL